MGHFIDCEKFSEGVYKMVFNTKPYFETQNVTTFYPYVEVNEYLIFEEKKSKFLPASDLDLDENVRKYILKYFEEYRNLIHCRIHRYL